MFLQIFPSSISEECLLKPHEMVFDKLLIAFSALYRLCRFFDEFIPLPILKHKVWDLNNLDIQKHPICDLALNALEHALVRM